jgi:hypothetical protein
VEGSDRLTDGLAVQVAGTGPAAPTGAQAASAAPQAAPAARAAGGPR